MGSHSRPNSADPPKIIRVLADPELISPGYCPKVQEYVELRAVPPKLTDTQPVVDIMSHPPRIRDPAPKVPITFQNMEPPLRIAEHYLHDH